MSLIHEALQKAESERRAGELPSLLSSPRMRPKRNTSLTMPLLLFAGVAIIAAAAYNNRSLIANSMPAKRDQTVDVAAAATSPEMRVPDSVALKPDVVRAEKTTSKPALPPPVEVAVEKSATSAAAPEAAATKPSPAATELIQNVEPMIAPTPIEAIAEVKVPDKPDPFPEPPVEASVPTMATPESGTSPSATPYIFELPLETRQALPNLKVTMHVYNDDPSKRFAIIDGKRINEGGVVGNELDMVEIQRDALLMKFRNERFLMPRLGR